MSSAQWPRALVINLPRHATRRASIARELAKADVPFEWAPAVDGSLLESAALLESVTPLGRALLTRGIIGCFLSHRRCWEACVACAAPIIVLEDDAVLAASFATQLRAILAELATLERGWDVLLVGALGCVHPRGRYGANVLHGLMGGGLRWPRSLSSTLHVPCRPFGTHAYVISPAGAERLLALCPRANFHVDVTAWGQRSLRLYLGTTPEGELLAKQAHQTPSTIGGLHDRAWLPTFTVDAYTGAEFAWAFNAPVLQVGGVVLTIGRSLCSTAALFVLAAATSSAACLWLACGWFSLQFALIQLLKAQTGEGPSLGRAITPWLPMALVVLMVAVGLGTSLGAPLGRTNGLHTNGPYGVHDPARAPQRPWLGPETLGHGGSITLERALPGGLPRLRLTGGRAYDEAALVATYTFFDRVLALRRPFTVLWDPRRVRWPRISTNELRMIRRWVDRNAQAWDTRVQAHALLLTNPVVRSIAQLIIRLFAPPQPVRIVASEEEADAFAATCCPRPRSWVKASYADRDERFGLFGGSWGLPSHAAPAAPGGAATAEPRRCLLSLPSASAWLIALTTHLGLSLGLGLPIGLGLRALHATAPAVRARVGLCVGVLVGAAVPAVVHTVRHYSPERMPWMAGFLASTFGFATAFKCAAFAFGTYPEGADASASTWLCWFTSLPEPCFAGGRLVRAAPGAFGARARLLVVKLVALGALLSALLSTDGRRLPIRLGVVDWQSAGVAGWVVRLLDAEAHLWVIYLWASLCLDVGALLVLAGGGTTEPPFDNPLLGSRSLRQAWGERWNRPVHIFLKRSVYRPARRLGFSPLVAALLTFGASGLLHEYNFSTHNPLGYVPGHASAFFMLMGLLMLAEGAVASRASRMLSPALRRAQEALPSPLIAIGLQLLVLPAFAPFFMRSWIESGMIEAVGALVPHLHCGHR